jgi:hypothetical protein
MSDGVSQSVNDWPRGRYGVRRPRAETTLGTRDDPALATPLGPGQSYDYQQVMLGARPRLTEEQIESLLVREFRSAKIYDDRLQIARAQAFRLYNGEPLGDEEPGRSQIVLTEVKDTIGAMMPTMIRTFAGAEKPVEFVPTSDRYTDEAQQAEDYVQHVCFTENDGWRAIHDAILDSMQLKVGWLKWWWDYSHDVKTEFYFCLLAPQLAGLLAQAGVTALRVVRRQARPDERAGILASPEAQVVGIDPRQPLLVYDAQITRGSPKNRPRLMAVPSEQVLIDTDANGPNDPCLRFICHWRIVTVSDLVALGFPLELVESRITQLQQQQNRVTRRRDRLAAIVPRPNSADPAMRRVRYMEAWMRFDNDGDGIAELHKLHAIGDYGFLLLGYEPASQVPLARVCPFMVPHRAVGESVADRLADVQKAMTRVFRNILDSMAEAIHPRTVIHDGMVSPDEAMNTEMGAIIRERVPNSIRELNKAFIGPSAIPIMEVLQQTKEQRTGVTRSSQGLTPDVLQSTTAIAVSAQVAASADRLEFVVRTVAEGIRDLYQGMLVLLCEHQDRSRTVLLRGRWVPIDPRGWMAAFHVEVRVGVGHGTLQQRIAALTQTAAAQQQAIQQLGPNNPLCGLGQLRNTLADMLIASGIPNPGRYWNDIPQNFQFQPAAPAPDANLIGAQAEMAKSQAALADVQTDGWRAVLEDDRLRDEGRAKAILQAIELAGKYGMRPDTQSVAGLFDRDPTSQAAIGLLSIGSNAASAAPNQGNPVPPAGPPAPIANPLPQPTPPAVGVGAGGSGGLARPLVLPPALRTALGTRPVLAGPAFGAGPPPNLAGPRP